MTFRFLRLQFQSTRESFVDWTLSNVLAAAPRSASARPVDYTPEAVDLRITQGQVREVVEKNHGNLHTSPKSIEIFRSNVFIGVRDHIRSGGQIPGGLSVIARYFLIKYRVQKGIYNRVTDTHFHIPLALSRVHCDHPIERNTSSLCVFRASLIRADLTSTIPCADKTMLNPRVHS